MIIAQRTEPSRVIRMVIVEYGDITVEETVSFWVKVISNSWA